MNYRTKTILRRGLPIVFWLLAAGSVIGIPLGFGLDVPVNYWWGFAAAGLVMVVVQRISGKKLKMIGITLISKDTCKQVGSRLVVNGIS